MEELGTLELELEVYMDKLHVEAILDGCLIMVIMFVFMGIMEEHKFIG